MTKQEAYLIKSRYECDLAGKPLSNSTPQFIIQDIVVKEVDHAYEVFIASSQQNGPVSYININEYLKRNV